MTIRFPQFKNRNSARHLPLILILVPLVCMSGCSGKKGIKSKVTGTVTYKGKNVAGDLVCVDEDGKELIPTPIRDGEFSLIDAPKGKYTILVRKAMSAAVAQKDTPIPKVEGPGGMKPALGSGATGVPPPLKAATKGNGIPPLEVTGGDQTFNITLTD